MNRLGLSEAAISLFLALGCVATARAQQTQAQQDSPPVPPPPSVVRLSPEELAAKSAAARQNGDIPPSSEQSAIQQLTATCKLNDPPANQAQITAAPTQTAASTPCPPKSADQRGKTDADVVFDAIMGDTVERVTGVPTDAVGAYQKVGTDLGAAALDSAAEELNSAFLEKAAEFVGSKAFGAGLSTTLASSEAGGPQDTMTLDQWQKYQQDQFQQMQSNSYLQNPGSFCLIFPNDSRCGGRSNDADPTQLCNNLRTAWSQVQSQVNGAQSGQMVAALQWCNQQLNGPVRQSYIPQTGPAFQPAPRQVPQQTPKTNPSCPPGSRVCR